MEGGVGVGSSIETIDDIILYNLIEMNNIQLDLHLCQAQMNLK